MARSIYLLIGNYGVGNLGDELLKEFFLAQFPNVDWQVVSAHPQQSEFSRLPGGIRSFLSFRWIATLRAFLRCDGVVFGGGSLFTDTESVYACILWWWHAFVAWLCKKPIILAFQGIGPFTTPTGRLLSQWVVARATHISVRDTQSYNRIEIWPKRCVVHRSFDPALQVFNQLAQSSGVSESRNTLTLVPRSNSNEVFFATLERLLAKDWDGVHILSLQPDHQKEHDICIRLQEQCPDAVIMAIDSAESLVGAIMQSSFVLTQRFHGAVAALACGVSYEVIMQKEGDKLNSIEQKNCTKDQCLQMIEGAVQKLKAVLV